jgi:thiol peroxidase
MNRTVSFENNPLSLRGRCIGEGDAAPPCTLTNRDAEEITLDSLGDTVKLVHFFQSLDTPICDLQVREFDRRAAALGADAPLVVGVSMDLPFAHKRFSETFGIRHTVLLSDHRYASFGINYGVLIGEWNLLARGCLVIDGERTIRYFQLVEEITNPPDFDQAFERLEEALRSARAPAAPSLAPRPGKALPLTRDAIGSQLARTPGWELAKGSRISRRYEFNSFAEAKRFLDMLSLLAEERNHHPSFSLDYDRLEVSLTTHTAGGLTNDDFAMARFINQLC